MDPTRVKKALADAFDTVAGINATRPYEVTQAPDLPFVSIVTSGFDARGLETPKVGQLTDPIGGRIRVYHFSVRLWVAMSTDEVKAQQDIDTLLPLLISKLDEDPSLRTWLTGAPPDNAVEDSTLSRADVGFMKDQMGNPLMVALCECSVSWTEQTT